VAIALAFAYRSPSRYRAPTTARTGSSSSGSCGVPRSITVPVAYVFWDMLLHGIAPPRGL
jgi:hypothetical protein